MHSPVPGIVIGKGLGAVGRGDRAGQAKHLTVGGGIGVGDRISCGISDGSQQISGGIVAAGGSDLLSVGTCQSGGGAVADVIVAVGFRDSIVGHRRNPVGVAAVIIAVVVSAASGGFFLDQQPGIGIGIHIRPQIGGFYGFQHAVLVIVHGLDNFPGQGDVVKIGGADVSFKGAGNPNGGNGFLRRAGNDGKAGELPDLHIRVEGGIVVFGAAVGIGDPRPETKLLIFILSRVGCGIHRIRGGVCFAPAGEDESSLAGEIHRNVLVCRWVRSRGAAIHGKISGGNRAVNRPLVSRE